MDRAEFAEIAEQARIDRQPRLGAVVSRSVMAGRLAAGVLQGLLLYGLYRAATDGAWPSGQPYLFVPLMLAGVLLPPLFISAIGHLDTRRAAIWIVAAASIMAALSAHDYASAGKWLDMIASDSEAPGGVRANVELLLGLVASGKPAPK